eukprot:scpid54064/ scgid2113/ Fibrillin-1
MTNSRITMRVAIQTSVWMLLLLNFTYATVTGFQDPCSPGCKSGETCLQGPTSSSCKYVMVHNPNVTSISSTYSIQALQFEVEYYDECIGRWVETSNFTAQLNGLPFSVVMADKHKGTYFRSRLNMKTPQLYTISVVTIGAPPTGHPTYRFPNFPYLISATDVRNNTQAMVTISLPTIEGSPDLQVEIGDSKHILAAVNTSESTVSHYVDLALSRQYQIRVSSRAASGSVAFPSMAVSFHIGGMCSYMGQSYPDGGQYTDNCAFGSDCTCNNGVGGCPNSKPCTDSPCNGTTHCCQECPPTWTDDINECISPANNCSPFAKCTNTYGSYTCTCRMGYHGNGATCNECKVDPESNIVTLHHWKAVPVSCKTGFKYIPTHLTKECQTFSETGFWKNIGECEDVNECVISTHDCHSSAVCTNTKGSFTCACKAGFSGDGKTCVEIDECSSGGHNCLSSAVCTNTVGAFTCACNPGLTGDGKTKCDDINECNNGSSCYPSATCANTFASFTCTCKLGFHYHNNTCKGATKCDDACTEISALPVVYANATSAQKICQGRKLAYHKDAKVVSLDSKPCVLNHFKAIGVESDTMFWASDPGSVTVPPQLLSSTANPGDQSRPYVVVCEFQKYDCKRTQCKQTCSEISIFPLRKTIAVGAENLCSKHFKSLGHTNPEYIGVNVARRETGQYGCVSRHLQENGMSNTVVLGGHGTAPDGMPKASNGMVLSWNKEAYVACEYRLKCSVQCKQTCSEISIFPLRVATAATANQVCAGSAFAKKYAQEFARVASAISEIFQCVTRHLQE